MDGPEDSRSRVKNVLNWFFTLITISYVKFSVGIEVSTVFFRLITIYDVKFSVGTKVLRLVLTP